MANSLKWLAPDLHREIHGAALTQAGGGAHQQDRVTSARFKIEARDAETKRSHGGQKW